MRSYLSLSVLLSFCLMFVVACSDENNNGGGGDGGGNGGGGAGGSMGPGVETRAITFGCSNNATAAISIIPGDLRVDVGPDPIAGGSSFTANLTGSLSLPEGFLDVAQGVIPGGVRSAELLSGQAIVQVRSGATQDGGEAIGVILGADISQLDPGEVSLCEFSLASCSVTTTQACDDDNPCPDGETCEGPFDPDTKQCDQANNNADGSNPECLPFVADGPECQDPVVIAEVPTQDGTPNSDGGCTQPAPLEPVPDCDCSACAALDTAPDTTKLEQCELNGFCVTDGLDLQLLAVDQAYTADASGDMLFGWGDEGLSGATLDADTGIYDIEQGTVETLEQGIAVDAGLVVTVSCVMAVDSAGDDGVAVCEGGDNDGQPCTSPPDVGNNICFGGDNDGDSCSSNEDCGGDGGGMGGNGGGDGAGGGSGETGPVCANADCGPEGECGPTDEASLTPDSALISFPIE